MHKIYITHIVLLMLNDDAGSLLDDHFLSDDEEVHINISQFPMLVGMNQSCLLDGISLSILVKFFVIQVQILGLHTVDVVEPVTHSIGLLEFETIKVKCDWNINLI